MRLERLASRLDKIMDLYRGAELWNFLSDLTLSCIKSMIQCPLICSNTWFGLTVKWNLRQSSGILFKLFMLYIHFGEIFHISSLSELLLKEIFYQLLMA